MFDILYYFVSLAVMGRVCLSICFCALFSIFQNGSWCLITFEMTGTQFVPPETPRTSLTIPQLVYNRLNETSPSSWLLQSYQVAMKLLNVYHSGLSFSSPKVKPNRAGHNKGLIVHGRGGPGISRSFTKLAKVTWLGQWSYSGR